MEWISVKDRLPEFEINVLVYYELDNGKETFKYHKIAHLDSITQYKDSQTAEWKDDDFNIVEPTHWQPLTLPEVEK